MSMVHFAIGVSLAALRLLGTTVLKTLAALLREASKGLPDRTPCFARSVGSADDIDIKQGSG